MKVWVIVVITMAVGLFGCSRKEEFKPDIAKGKNAKVGRPTLIQEVKPDIPVSSSESMPERQFSHDDDHDLLLLSDEDARVCAAIRTALDDDDINGVLAAIKGSHTNADAKVRREAVEALAWFSDDLRAIEGLQKFIEDPDCEIAADAFRRMDENTDLIENENDKNNFLLQSFYRYSSRPEIIDFVCDKLKAADCNEATMKTLLGLTVSGEPLAMARAKEAYKFITGETYISSEKAMQWIKENGE